VAEDETDLIAKSRVKLTNGQEEATAGGALIIAVLDQRVPGVGGALDVIPRLNGQ
jgi:hypothetical protein